MRAPVLVAQPSVGDAHERRGGPSCRALRQSGPAADAVSVKGVQKPPVQTLPTCHSAAQVVQAVLARYHPIGPELVGQDGVKQSGVRCASEAPDQIVTTRQVQAWHHPLVGVVEPAGQDCLAPESPFDRSLESVADGHNSSCVYQAKHCNILEKH